MPNWRIMIVDDEPDLISLLTQVISTRYEVVVAHNGMDALEKLDRYEPDFIILDVMMPLMDGFDACAAIRKKNLYKDAPIYFLTSSSDREDIKKGYALGCNLYLQKPFDPFRLLKNIDFYYEKNPIPPKTKKYNLKQLQEMDAKPSPRREFKPSPEKKILVRVMYIDDNEETLGFVSFALKNEKDPQFEFEIITTSQPIEALSQIVHYEPDIVLLDIKMPKLDGFQLSQIIKINQNLKSTEIQFVSAVATPKDVEYVNHVTGNPLLRKPFEIKSLVQALKNICRKPEFHIKEKRISYEEIQKELRIEKQSKEDEIRRIQEQKAIQDHLKPLTEFYKDFEKKEKKS
ncbi:response regulator [Candidatus Sumerlaeota bacterium]|nr:response regulator [Candidatus Sumerlaeota bacterium]